jgi:hypothetical protein
MKQKGEGRSKDKDEEEGNGGGRGLLTKFGKFRSGIRKQRICPPEG